MEPQFSFSQGFSISVQCETQEEIDTYWKNSPKGSGNRMRLAHRQVRPVMASQSKLLMEMLSDHDPSRCRSYGPMMTMIKIESQDSSAWDGL